MKHTRLLEIIREEIAGALNEKKGNVELPSGTPTSAAQQYINKGIDISFVDKNGKTTFKEAQLEEDALNEMAYDITIKNPEKLAKLKDEIKDSPKEGKKLLYKVIDIIQRDKKENKPIRQRDIANELELIQQKVNPFVNLLIDLEILEKGESVTGVTKKKVTDKAQGRPAGEPKAEKPSSTGKKGRPAGEPKTEKSATLTKGDDGFDDVSYSDVEVDDKEATQNIGSDKTAQKLGKVAYSKNLTPEEETQYKTARDGINAKIKRIEDGEEKPNDRALLQRAYQNSEIQRLYKAKGLSLDDILKGIIG
jgi:hypothetical protein